MAERRKPGVVRDAIVEVMRASKAPMTVAAITDGVRAKLGDEVPGSSVRSYLRLNTPGTFIRTEAGTYRLVRR